MINTKALFNIRFYGFLHRIMYKYLVATRMSWNEEEKINDFYRRHYPISWGYDSISISYKSFGSLIIDTLIIILGLITLIFINVESYDTK